MSDQYRNSKNGKKPKKPAPDRTIFGTYVAPVFSTIGNQFTGRAALFRGGKNNTQTGRYSN